ncbi:hypothetical protein LHM76_001430 [Listeria monocytogenes]|nr:hypothetical protein [Listeria monocytogenes]EII4616116.1 hypothetical protein [Listeria monocytogenes]
MKKIIFNFLKKLIQILLTFTITFVTAVVASDNQNNIYTFLDRHWSLDANVKRLILSGLIVGVVGILQSIVWLTNSLFLIVVRRYFKRLTIDIKFKIRNQYKDFVKFKTTGNAYLEEGVEVEINVCPAGKLSMLILKLLGLKLEMFFNPEIVDITLVNDNEWLDEEAVTTIIEKQTLYIDVLKNYRLDGKLANAFKMTEDVIIVPKRVKRATTSVNFQLKTVIGSKLGNVLCESSMADLNIECEGGKLDV